MRYSQFKQLLNKAYKQSEISGSTIIFQFTTSINVKIDTILSSISVKKDMFYMNFPNDKIIYLGIGKEISQKISSKKDLSNIIQNKYTVINNNNQKLEFFGGIAFNLKDESFFPWKNIDKGEFYIPKILIKENNTIEFTYSRYIDNSIQKKSILKDYKHSLLLIKKQKIKNIKPPNIYQKYEIPNKKKYLESIQKIIKKIKTTKLDKVVISRLVKYNLSSKICTDKFINYLNKTHKNCFNFFICFNKNHTFIGSSPEKLISLKNKSYSIDAIAGSSSNKRELKSKKEINEHTYVTKHIYDRMIKISTKFNQSKKPGILKLNYINHLYTKISGRLKNKTHILALLSNLYPTPALLGDSSDMALKYIKKTEKSDRGWYAGAIGMYDENGDGKFYVPIRSGIIKNKNLLLFTGSGIVSQSNPEKEWDETTLKLEHILSYFN